MGVRLDSDKPTESRASAIVERVLVEQVARRMRTRVVLQRPGIELLAVIRYTNREHIAARAFASQAAQPLKTRIGAAEMNVQAQSRGVALDRRGIDLKGEH